MSALKSNVPWLSQTPDVVLDIIKDFKWKLEKPDHEDAWESLRIKIMFALCDIRRWTAVHGMPSDKRIQHFFVRYRCAFLVRLYGIYRDYSCSEMEMHVAANTSWFDEACGRFMQDSDNDRKIWMEKERARLERWTRDEGQFAKACMRVYA